MVSLPESPSVLPIRRSASQMIVLPSISSGRTRVEEPKVIERESNPTKTHRCARSSADPHHSELSDNAAARLHGSKTSKATAGNISGEHDVVRVDRAVPNDESNSVDADFLDTKPLDSHLLSMQTESMRVLVNLMPRRRAPRPILTGRSDNVVGLLGNQLNEQLEPLLSRKPDLPAASPASRMLPYLEGDTREQSDHSKSLARPETFDLIPWNTSEYSRKQLPPTPSPTADYFDSGVISPVPSFGHSSEDQQHQRSARRSVSTPGLQWDGLNRHAPSRASSSRSSVSCRLLTPTFGESFSISPEDAFDIENWPLEGSEGSENHGTDQRYLQGIAGIHGILLSPKEQTTFVLPDISPATLDPVQWGMAV